MDQDPKTTLPKGKPIVKITHYFNKIGVAVIELSDNLKVGDEIVISAHSGDFEQKVDSLQAEHEQIVQAKAGEAVGLKVAQAVKNGDLVYLKG